MKIQFIAWLGLMTVLSVQADEAFKIVSPNGVGENPSDFSGSLNQLYWLQDMAALHGTQASQVSQGAWVYAVPAGALAAKRMKGAKVTQLVAQPVAGLALELTHYYKVASDAHLNTNLNINWPRPACQATCPSGF